MRLPKMYQQITLQDGRKCTVIDYMGDIIIADTRDEQGEWTSLSIYMEGEEFFECGEEGKVYNICPRKDIHLQVSKDREYCFLLGEKFEGEYVYCIIAKLSFPSDIFRRTDRHPHIFQSLIPT